MNFISPESAFSKIASELVFKNIKRPMAAGIFDIAFWVKNGEDLKEQCFESHCTSISIG